MEGRNTWKTRINFCLQVVVRMKSDLKVFIWQGGWLGGAERVMLGLAETFKSYARIEPVLGVFEKNENIDFEQVCVSRIFPEKAVGYNTIWASFYLNRKGILDDFDIVIAHGGGMWKTRKNFYVCHEAGDLDALAKNLPLFSKLTFFPLKELYICFIKKSDLIISATRECDRFLERHGVRDYVKGRNFVDTKFFRPKGKKPGGAFKILFVGRDEPRKNLGALKEVCRKLRGVELNIIGAVGENEGDVRYLGYVSDEELAEWYRRSHLFVLPSFWEGFSVSILEAMASGTPVLASVYAIPEELKKFAITFDPYSKNELSKKIQWIMENYEDVTRIAKKARNFVVKNYEKEMVLRWEVETILERFRRRKRR
ncbi:MAG: glycosyltransferase family 4 protein [Candidatus Hadarchaeales archaeon]